VSFQNVVVLKDWENRQTLLESLQDLSKPCVNKCVCRYLCKNQKLDSCVCGVWHGIVWVLVVWCRTQALLGVPCPNLSCFMLGHFRATLMERQMALRVPSPPLW